MLSKSTNYTRWFKSSGMTGLLKCFEFYRKSKVPEVEDFLLDICWWTGIWPDPEVFFFFKIKVRVKSNATIKKPGTNHKLQLFSYHPIHLSFLTDSRFLNHDLSDKVKDVKFSTFSEFVTKDTGFHLKGLLWPWNDFQDQENS